MRIIHIHPKDNVAVTLEDVAAGKALPASAKPLTAVEQISRGHKVAVQPIAQGDKVVKYGYPIGQATQDIAAGAWVHVHNTKTDLTEDSDYRYAPRLKQLAPLEATSFQGYRRGDGRAATRNELWIIPTVGCVNTTAQTLARDNQHLVKGNLEGLHAFAHPYGCSQMGEDHAQTRKLLAALANHPNAGGVLVLGLGCENLTMEEFKEALGTWDDQRVKFLVCQEVADELEAGAVLLHQLAAIAQMAEREPLPASELVVGLKCGGSDGLSGITANPAVGRFSDLLTAMGGTTVLTEVPEMFGAENILLERCVSEAVYHDAVQMLRDFKQYYTSHNQVVYENPSPGNKAGGITTLEDKSCGCVQKGGTAPVVDVLAYADQVRQKGLTLLSAPGNDLVSTTALAAAGAQLVLFTTGRGTPFGSPVPTIKISSNTALYEGKRAWIDFDAGTVAAGESLEDIGRRLLDYVIRTASGEKTSNERRGAREIAIFKDGVVL